MTVGLSARVVVACQTSPKASPADTPDSATRLTAPDGHLRRHGPELVIATRTDLTWLVYGRVSDRGNISRHREQMALSEAVHLSKPAKSGHTVPEGGHRSLEPLTGTTGTCTKCLKIKKNKKLKIYFCMKSLKMKNKI